MAQTIKVCGQKDCTVNEMKYGTLNTIPCGDLEIRVYNTRDALWDQVILLVKDGNAVVLELPCFKNSIEELTSYIKEEGLEVVGKLVAYHAAGSSFLPEVKSYLTESSHSYNTIGGGAGLVRNFQGIFGDSFDAGLSNEGEIIGAGKRTVAGIEIEIVPDQDAFEVLIPSAKAAYMHMLGHDCHSIVAGAAHADAMISHLNALLDEGYQIFLSSHYTPEGREDVITKIAYLEGIKKIASECDGRQSFLERMRSEYSGYSGDNYLEMTAGFFFTE